MSSGEERQRVVVLDDFMPMPTVPEILSQGQPRASLSAEVLLSLLRESRTLTIVPIRGDWLVDIQPGYLLWLPRQRELAIARAAWVANPPGYERFGSIVLRRDAGRDSQRDESWVCDLRGNGCDGLPILQPATHVGCLVEQLILEAEEAEVRRLSLAEWSDTPPNPFAVAE